MKKTQPTIKTFKNYFKNLFIDVWNALDKKQRISIVIFSLLVISFIISNNSYTKKIEIRNTTAKIEHFNKDYKILVDSMKVASEIEEKKKKLLFKNLEPKINSYLNNIPDLTYIERLKPFLSQQPEKVDYIPSISPMKVKDFSVSSNYGYRIHPIRKYSQKHNGIDLAAKKDTQVLATANGYIESVSYLQDGYGYHIIIRHRYGFKSLYAHLNYILVKKGARVQQGDVIGTVGITGSSTGYHLHYGVKKNNQYINPNLSLFYKKDILTHYVQSL